jgi:TetR/AcrR family transcriptional repressor of nem operon
MPRDGTATRLRILDAAQRLTMGNGFAATSVDDIIAAADTTKGGFYNHFPTKQDLGRELVQRYCDEDAALLADLAVRSARLADDPLQRLLIFIGLLADAVDEAIGEMPGCLVASFCYQRELVDDDTRALMVTAFQRWATEIRSQLDQVVEVYPPRRDVDLDAIADQAATTVEGCYVMVRVLDDFTFARRQLMQLRNYLELLFAPEPRG